MADNKKQLSDITIAQSNGKTTAAHFAADINNFMVYDDDGAESSVKDLVFGDTDPGTFKSTDTADNSMWGQLSTKAQECYDILDKNKSFWNGLSKEQYHEPGKGEGTYLASGNQMQSLWFYGDDMDSIEGEEEKLVSLGALEDFAKRIPTMGGYHDIGQDHVALNPNSSATGTNSFAVNGGIAWGNNSIALNGGQAMANNSVSIGKGTFTSKDGQVVLGQYNARNENAIFVIGTGTSDASRRDGFKIDKDGNVWLPKMRKGSNNLNDNEENYIKQDSDVSQALPAGFISGTFTVGYRKVDNTWLDESPQTFNLEKGVQTSLTLYLGQISDSEVIRADIEYDGKYFVNIQGTKASKADGHEESVTITLLYAEMCAINFF